MKKARAKQFVVVDENGKTKSFSATTTKEARSLALNFLAKGILPTPGTKLYQQIKW